MARAVGRVRLFSIFAVALLATAAVAQAQARSRFDLPPQPLADSLRAVGSQANINVLFDPPLVADHQAPALKGEYTSSQAFTLLLVGTGIRHEFMNDHTVVLAESTATGGSASPEAGERNAPRSGKRERSERASFSSSADSSLPSPRERGVGSEASSLWQRFRLAQVNQASQPSSVSSQGDEKRLALEEIIVTAQKRVERLRDVPVPVTAIDAESLVSTNQPRLRDYYTRIPGLNLTDAGIYGGSVISFRGITSGILNGGTTTVVVDDVPYGISSNPGGPTSVVPEIDPNDLVRLEALRGPQGTLYGASSMGGLLKYVTADPSVAGRSGYLRGGLNGVRHGDGSGYSASGGINMPLSDTMAVRASVYSRRDPGYIDDPVHAIDGLNWEKMRGGRVSALWQASDSFSLKLGALYQDSDSGGNSYSTPTFGTTLLDELQQVSPPGAGGYEKVLEVYTAHVTARVANVDVAAISAYTLNDAHYEFDVTPSAFFRGNAQTLFGEDGAQAVSIGTTKRFTQEIRLTIPLSQQAQWLLGGFYADEENPRLNRYFALDFDTGERAGLLGILDFPGDYQEESVFTDLTYHFTDQFDVQIGGRIAYMTVTQPYNSSTGIFGAVTQGEVEFKDRAFTFLFTPRLRVSENLMVYARFASGYRPGGPNLANTQLDPSIPQAFEADETTNYEIGAKGGIFDGVLTYDASVYYIEWDNIQLQSLFSPTANVNYKANGGVGKSQGVDLALDARPAEGLKISLAAAWNLAELTENFPAQSTVTGVEGDRLPFSSRFTGSLSVDWEFPVGAGEMRGYVGASGNYVGERRGPFLGGTATRATLPEYFMADVRAGVRRNSWEANVYVNNIGDKRALLMGGAGSFLPNIFSYARPRTLGLTLSKTF